MTQRQLRQALISAGITNPDSERICDDVYACPTRSWFFGPFAAALAHNMRVLGVDRARPEVNDCDDFSRRAVTQAKDCNARSNPNDADLAVGSFDYYIDAQPGAAHNIVFAIVFEDGQYNAAFMEPQTQKEIVLSKSEKYLCKGFDI